MVHDSQAQDGHLGGTASASESVRAGPLIHRQTVWTRVTHWVWAVCLFFLLLSGLQIFNAHPSLYIGQQSGFGFDNSVLSMDTIDTPQGVRGRTTILGHSFDTTSSPSERARGQSERFAACPRP